VDSDAGEYVQHVHRVRSSAVDAVIVVAAVWALLDVALRRGAASAPHVTLWFALPALALVALPVLAHRRVPLAPALMWLVAAAVSFVDGRLVTFSFAVMIIGFVAAFLLGNLRDEFDARIGLLIVLGSGAVIAYNDPKHDTGELVYIPFLFAVAWLAGSIVRERSEQAEAAETRARRAEAERESAARLAVAEERARIARELHDIVAHAVSVMVLQVGAVRHRLPDELADDRDALTDVEGVGRGALAEMRRLLGAMRRETDELDFAPQPGIERLDALLTEIRTTGLRVDLDVEGKRVPLPPAVDLSAYRIIQEGLTNVRKHAHADHAEVTLCYGNGDLQIAVRDDGVGSTDGDGLGHGLVGVRERVKIYGGEMTAGPAPGGGFLLRARLPLEPER
jgi:signal transduction histidine kinase